MEQARQALRRLVAHTSLAFAPNAMGPTANASRLVHGTCIPYADRAINPLHIAPGDAAPGGPPGGPPGGTAGGPTGVSVSAMGEKRAHAVLRGARIGPRKLNSFVDVIRGVHIEDALIQCKIHSKKAARLTGKLLESARANAVNNHGLDASQLKVEQAWVGKGQYLRRVSIHGRGRSGVMHKTRSHLTVVLAEDKDVQRRVKVMPMLQERQKWKR